MSELIIEFAKPILDKVDTFNRQKSALSMAIMAWNISLSDELTPDVQIHKFCNEMNYFKTDEMYHELRLIMNSLVQRKLQIYHDYKWLVIDYDIINTGSGFHLNVVSSPLKGDNEIEALEKEANRLYEAGEISLPS